MRENRVCLDSAGKCERQEMETGVFQEKRRYSPFLALCCSEPACTRSVAGAGYMVPMQQRLNFG